MAGQGVLAEAFLDHAGESVKAFSQVGRPCAEGDAYRGRKLGEHQWPPWREPSNCPAAVIAARSNRGLRRPWSRTTQALVSTISSWVPASGPTIDTGTKWAGAAAGAVG